MVSSNQYLRQVFLCIILKHIIIFWKQNRIYSYHPKAAAHFDEPAIPGKEAAQLFVCD